MGYDNRGIAALGIGFFILILVIYLAVLALAMWIGYLIMRTAVKNGVILALQQTGQQFPPAGGYRPPMPPQAPYQGPPVPPTPPTA